LHQRSGRVAGASGRGCSDRHPHRHRVRLSGALRGHRHRVGGEQHRQDLPSLDMAALWGRGRAACCVAFTCRWYGAAFCRRHAGVHRIHEGAARRPAAAAVQLRTLATHVYQFVSDEMLERVRSVPSSSCWWGWFPAGESPYLDGPGH
jgi:hypothetical protein